MIMKIKFYFLLFAVTSTLAFQSCDNNDNLKTVPVELQNAFANKYPGIQKVDWEQEGGYYVADFMDGAFEASAWFDKTAKWVLTETDLIYQSLPNAVKATFENSEYNTPTWKLDDIDRLDRPEQETIYVIEVESKTQDLDLLYRSDGVLIKSVVDENDRHYPNNIY